MIEDSILLKDATMEQIKGVANKLGYNFNDEDCADLRKTCAPWNRETETLLEAVNDYLDAFER